MAFALGRASGQAQETPEAPAPAPVAKSVVYSVTNRDAIHDFEENHEITRRMVDELVTAATHEPDIARAWRSLVSPTDRVGIKIATSGGQYFCSHRGVVAAILAGLESAGVPRQRVIVWDRESANLRAAGYLPDRLGCIVRAIDPPRGFDPAAKIVSPIFGRLIWGDFEFHTGAPGHVHGVFEEDQMSAQSHIASLLVHEVNKVINVAALSDERGCGIAGALYNMTVPNIDNSRRFSQPGGGSSIVDLYGNPQIGRKVVLHIMDALVAQYAGGPQFDPNYAIQYKTLFAGKDPVAIDATAFRLLEYWRSQSKLPPIGEKAEWLQEAEVMRLGHYAEDEIEVRRLAGAP